MCLHVSRCVIVSSKIHKICSFHLFALKSGNWRDRRKWFCLWCLFYFYFFLSLKFEVLYFYFKKKEIQNRMLDLKKVPNVAMVLFM